MQRRLRLSDGNGVASGLTLLFFWLLLSHRAIEVAVPHDLLRHDAAKRRASWVSPLPRLAEATSSQALLPGEPVISWDGSGADQERASDWTESWPEALVYRIQHNSDDGTEVGDTWYPHGYAGSLDYLGRDDVESYTAGVRFAVPDLEQGQSVKYARLRLAAQGGEVTSQANLVISGADEDSPETFSDTRRPSVLPKTDTSVDWTIGNAWRSPGSCAGLYYSSPNLANIINEILSRPNWGQDVEGKTLILIVEGGNSPEGETNALTFEDYSIDPQARDEAILEIYATLADAFVGKPMLGRPTDSSITVNVINLLSIDIYAEHGTEAGSYTDSTVPLLSQPGGEEVEIVITGLEADTDYYYRIRYREAGDPVYLNGMEGCFHTQRARGSGSVFTIQADSHLWPLEHTGDTDGLRLYKQSIANIGLDNPDFHLSLGDFSHVECYSDRDVLNAEDAVERYLGQRRYLDTVAHSVPMYLVLGNHDAEQGWRVADPADSVAIWGARARKKVIVNPGPDGFYSGDETVTECCGHRENYYAWEWGDALFVVLDPFWYTTTKPHCVGIGDGSEDPWDWTLGQEQYNWLYTTLHDSDAAWKLVFTHHLVGGVRSPRGIFWTPYGRGGTEAAKYRVDGRGSYEWGGEGSWGWYLFECKRPGWAHEPIHDMMVNEGVAILFHGHDHVFVHQELDGIVYQACPQPSDFHYSDGWYDHGQYHLGTKRNNSGHVRVAVNPDHVQVDYVRSVLPEDEPLLEDGNLIYNRQVAYSYTLGMAGSRECETGADRPRLLGVRPNPFSAKTRISLFLPEEETISLKIYDVKGQLIDCLLDGIVEAGTHEIDWDATSEAHRPLAPGVYFCRLEGGGLVASKKVLAVR